MVGQAFDLDGIDDYVRAPYSLSSNTATTIDAWIKPSASVSSTIVKIGDKRTLFWSGTGTSGDVFFGGTTTSLAGANQGVYASAFGIPINAWTHVVGTWDGTTARIYINGVLRSENSTPNGNELNAFPDTSIGYGIVGYGYFLGLIDEVEIYNRALTAAEIEAIFNAGSAGKCKVNSACVSPPADMVSWWPGDDNANDIQDGNNGSLMNGTGFAPGQVGPSFSFDGMDDKVLIGNPTNLQLQDFTIDAWIKLNTLDIDGFAKRIAGYSIGGYGFFLAGPIVVNPFGASAVRQLSLDKPGFDMVAAPFAVDDTDWHHVAVTKSGGTVTFYLDGVPGAAQRGGLPFPVYNPGFAFNTNFALGSIDLSDTQTLPGLLDEVEVFNRALSAAEIQAIFNAGSAGKCKGGPTPNQPPVADAGPDQTVECTSPSGADVTLDGTGSYDPDGDTLSYLWTNAFGSVSGATPTVSLPLGEHTLTLTVSDPSTAGDSDTVSVEVVDTTGPVIGAAVASPSMLWPPNHKMVPVTVSVAAADVCDTTVDCTIIGVTSNEPDNGLGDGDTAPDIAITGDLTVDLRAERSGKGSGRIYTVQAQCVDDSGNSSDRLVTVTVPHSKGK